MGFMLKMSPSITPTLFIDIISKFAGFFSQKMVSSSSSSEAVEAVLGIVAKGNAILAEISRLAEVLVLAPFPDMCPHHIYCFMKLCLWRKTKIKIFAPQNIPTLFLEGKGEGSQLLFDFAYFKVFYLISTFELSGQTQISIFPFLDVRDSRGPDRKGRRTCRRGRSFEGGTSEHPHTVQDHFKPALNLSSQVLPMFWEHSVVRRFCCAAGGGSWGGKVG